MKKIVLSLFLIIGITTYSFSQDFSYSYGLKGGINYSMGGEIEGQGNPWSETAEAQSKVGYTGGVFFQAGLGKFFVRPEITYSSLQTEYEFPLKTSAHSVKKFDIPVLLGFNIYGPVDLFAGPVYSNILSSNLEGNESDEDIVVQNSPINLHLGAKVEFGRFGIDLRYERTLSPAESQTLDLYNQTGPPDKITGANVVKFLDPRIHQIILTATFKLGGSDMAGRARKGSPCY